MERSIYKYVLRHSLSQQLKLLALTVCTFPILYVSLDLPKVIVNDAISGAAGFPIVWDLPFLGAFEIDQIPYLMALSVAFLVMVVINGGIKFYLNVSQGRLGERLLRRLRYTLYSRVLRFPLPHFRKVSQGEIIPMITSEVELLGGFMGAAFVTPIFQGGYLLTLIGFMIIQDWLLGALAVSLYPVQAYFIPKLQHRVNMLAKQRVRTVRKLAERVGETISGIGEVHANDTSNLERTDISDRLGVIYDIRYDIFKRKYFIKFLNNFIAQLTPFFFYSVGGYLVIVGNLTFGALVAVLAAYKDLAGPWKELLNFYQIQADSRIKYEQVVEQFEPPEMLDERLQIDDPGEVRPFEGAVKALNVGLADEDGAKRLQGVDLDIALNQRVAVVGDAACGKDELAQVLARLLRPTGGNLEIGGRRAADLSEAETGQRMAYVGQNAYLFTASVRENLVYGLRHRPLTDADGDEARRAERREWVEEALRAGNSPYDSAAPWTDLAAAGVDDDDGLIDRAIELLRLVDLEEDVYRFGLRGAIDPKRRPENARAILSARAALRERLDADPQTAALIEPFDETKYNTNATVAENLLFGNPVGDGFDLDNLAENPYVLSVLDAVGLTGDFLTIGRQVAETTVEIFADLPPGHEFFDLFSFISSDELPDMQALLNRAAHGLDELNAADRTRLMSLPFKVVPGRHRLGLVDESTQERLLAARARFRADLPAELADSVEFFAAGAYNSVATIQNNILFGKIVYGQAHAAERVNALVAEALDTLGLRRAVLESGLDYPVGIAGSRLSAAQRQKLAIARAAMKRPDLLILNEAIAALDAHSQRRLLEGLLKEFEGRGLFWVVHRASQARAFDKVLVMAEGRVVEQGEFAELDREGARLRALLEQEA